MTNGWIDIKNTDMMLIMGGNPAENHPCGFKWAMEAKKTRNAKMIVVDPRYTRTASTSDLFLQIRAGSDIAFLGGLINYVIQNNRIAKDYLLNYTSAPLMVAEGFKLPEDGFYSGFDPATQTYDRTTWNYAVGGDMSGKCCQALACSEGPRSILPNLPSRSRSCRRRSPTISLSSIRAASSSYSSSSTRVTRRRWWSASPEFLKINS